MPVITTEKALAGLPSEQDALEQAVFDAPYNYSLDPEQVHDLELKYDIYFMIGIAYNGVKALIDLYGWKVEAINSANKDHIKIKLFK